MKADILTELRDAAQALVDQVEHAMAAAPDDSEDDRAIRKIRISEALEATIRAGSTMGIPPLNRLRTEVALREACGVHGCEMTRERALALLRSRAGR